MELKYIFIISIISLPIIIFKLIIYIYEWHKDRKLLRTGKETIGIIVDEGNYDANDSPDSPCYYSCFFAQYEVDNKTYQVKSRFWDNKHKLLGKQYVIIYDPEKPEWSRFKCDDTLIWPVKYSLFALIIIMGIFIYGLATLDF
jgi:hypothetical protein